MNSPFNEAKYKALLKGLEISEVSKLDVLRFTVSARIDSDYFRKEYLKEDLTISSKNNYRLDDITNKIDVGFVGSMTNYYRAEGIPLLQTNNITSFFVTDDETIKITGKFHKELKKSQVNYKDILIARSGSFGKASIYLENQIINSSDIIIIQANENIINPFYLTAYLNSKVGVNQMIRFSSGGLQGHVNLTILEELKVPIVDESFQEIIENLLNKAYETRQFSKKKYRQAENLLLEAVGLKDFEPSKEKVNVKSFRNSFLSKERIDAEYYQPKYEQIVNLIKKQNFNELENLIKIKKSIEPGSKVYSNEGIPFLRVSDYDKFGISEPDKKLSKDFCKENAELIKKLKPKKDTILFSKDGSVGTAYKLREDLEVITSGAVLHLTVKDKSKVLPEYLTLVLNSKMVQMQAERDAGGSIILHWRLSEIESVVVPIIDYDIQKEISNLIEESFKLKKESENLLEIAKRAVEMAIEEDEETATEFIRGKV